MPSLQAAAIIGSTAISAGSSLYAGSQQANSANKANELQGQIYQQNRADLTPWRQTGSNALSLLAQSLGVTPYSAGGVAPGTATDPSQTPGMLAARAAGPHSGGKVSLGSVDPFNIFGMSNNASPIQDIAGALQQGKTITDAQWAQAGYGPGGSGGPGQGGTAEQPQVTQAPSSGPYGAFTASPGYQFAYDEGLKATDQGAAARGMLRSGAALKGEQRFGTGLANQEFGNWQNRLAALAGIGQTATNTGVQLGQNYATNSGSLLQDAAAARASGYAGAGSSIGNGLLGYAVTQNMGGSNSNSWSSGTGATSYDPMSGNWTLSPQGF